MPRRDAWHRLEFVRRRAVTTVWSAPAFSSATPRHSHPQQEREEQRAERRVPREFAQDAERHAGFLAFLARVADAIAGAPDGVGNFFDPRLGFGFGIQA